MVKIMSKIVFAAIHLVDLKPTVPRSDAIQAFESQETPIVVIRDSQTAPKVSATHTQLAPEDPPLLLF
jgi:hypothetical protein